MREPLTKNCLYVDNMLASTIHLTVTILKAKMAGYPNDEILKRVRWNERNVNPPEAFGLSERIAEIALEHFEKNPL